MASGVSVSKSNAYVVYSLPTGVSVSKAGVYGIFENSYVRTISPVGGDWNSPSTWLEGAVPTSADIVVGNSDSGNLTLNSGTFYCKSLNFSQYTKTASFGISASSLIISEYIKLNPNLTLTFAAAPTIYLAGSTDNGGQGWDVDLAGKTSIPYLNFSGTGKWVLRNDIYVVQTFYFTGGSLDWNGFSISSGDFYDAQSVTPKSWNMRNGTLTLRDAYSFRIAQFTSNWTVDAGTSKIICEYVNSNVMDFVNTANITFYDITFKCPISIYGSSTFHNFTKVAYNVAVDGIYIAGNLTVTGTFTYNGNPNAFRGWIRPKDLSTPVTVFSAANLNVSYLDFSGISEAGTANWDLSGITGLSGDAGGNSGITFSPSTTCYWYCSSAGANKGWSNSSYWFKGSGGTGGLARVPLPQDTAIINSSSNNANIMFSEIRLCSRIDFTGSESCGSYFYAGNSTYSYIFGDFIFSNAVNSVRGIGGLVFYGTGTYSVKIPASNLLPPIWFYRGTFNLLCDLNTNGAVFLPSGTLNANNFNVSCDKFDSVYGNGSNFPKTLNMGDGTWNVKSYWTWATNGTINAGNSTLNFLPTTGTYQEFSGGGATYNIVNFVGNAHYFKVFDNCTFRQWNLLSPGQIIYLTGNNQTITILDSMSAVGTPGNLIDIEGLSFNWNLIKASGRIGLDYVKLKFAQASGGATFYAGSHSTNLGNNSANWIWADAPAATTGAISITEAKDLLAILADVRNSLITGSASITEVKDALAVLADVKGSVSTALLNAVESSDVLTADLIQTIIVRLDLALAVTESRLDTTTIKARVSIPTVPSPRGFTGRFLALKARKLYSYISRFSADPVISHGTIPRGDFLVAWRSRNRFNTNQNNGQSSIIPEDSDFTGFRLQIFSEGILLRETVTIEKQFNYTEAIQEADGLRSKYEFFIYQESTAQRGPAYQFKLNVGSGEIVDDGGVETVTPVNNGRLSALERLDTASIFASLPGGVTVTTSRLAVTEPHKDTASLSATVSTPNSGGGESIPISVYPAGTVTEVDLPWATTFNYAACSIRGYRAGIPDCKNVQTDGINWDWGGDDIQEGSQYTTHVTPLAGRTGGNGFRFYVADGRNTQSGQVQINFKTPQKEFWMRWYERYEAGFKWVDGLPEYTKEIYFKSDGGSNPSVGFYWDKIRMYNQNPYWGQGPYAISDTFGWNSIYPTGVADGTWHCFEVHLKMDNAANNSNGVGEIWVDGELVASCYNVNWSGGDAPSKQGWTWLEFRSNQAYANNGRIMYVDYDDMAISNTGRIGL